MNSFKEFLPYYTIAASLLWIANWVWAFSDARRRGRSGVIVALLVLGTFPLGVALWLVARPRIDFRKQETKEEIDPLDAPPAAAGEDYDAALKRRANGGLL